MVNRLNKNEKLKFIIKIVNTYYALNSKSINYPILITGNWISVINSESSTSSGKL